MKNKLDDWYLLPKNRLLVRTVLVVGILTYSFRHITAPFYSINEKSEINNEKLIERKIK